MNKWLVIGGVVVLVLLLAKKANASPTDPAYVYDPGNWYWSPVQGKPNTGGFT